MNCPTIALHEVMHAVAAGAFLRREPKRHGARVVFTIEKNCGECAIVLPTVLRDSLEFDHDALSGWLACGPLGLLEDPHAIGRAIAAGHYADWLSWPDMELAARIPVMDRFVAATSAHLWRMRLKPGCFEALDRTLTSEEFLRHEPMLLLSAFCPPGQMESCASKAHALVTTCLPAAACVNDKLPALLRKELAA